MLAREIFWHTYICNVKIPKLFLISVKLLGFREKCRSVCLLTLRQKQWKKQQARKPLYWGFSSVIMTKKTKKTTTKKKKDAKHQLTFFSLQHVYASIFHSFLSKIGMESVLENFASISRHLRTALKSCMLNNFYKLNEVALFDLQNFFLHYMYLNRFTDA